MTAVNMIPAAAAAPAGAHPASPEAAAADGATFGAALDQAMRTTQAAAGPAPTARPDPGTPAARHGAADGKATGLGGVAEAEPAGKAAPVSEAKDEPTPSLAEIALPIEALTSFLAAFIALAVQARPAGGASAEIGAGDDGVSVAAVGLSVAAGGRLGRAQELAALARLVGGESAANDEGGLAALFATLGDETGTEALEPIGQAAAAREATPGGDASLGALVDALVELATRAGASENGRAAVALAALVDVDDGAAAAPTPGAAAAAASLQPVAEVARLVATLTRELSAAAGHVDASQGRGAGPEGVGPELSATARTLVALADAGQAVRVGQVSGRSQVTVQLQPESLGKVTIEVERTGEGAVARIVASTAEAQRAIAENLGAVRGALAAIGVEVGRVEVSGPRTGAATPAEAGFDAALDAARRPAGQGEPTGPAAGGPETRLAAATKGTDGEEPVEGVEQPADWAAATNAVAARTAPVEGAAAAPETAPARTGVAQLVRDIADQAGVLLGQGKSQFQLQLRPESLGRLHVRMTLEAGEVTVQMRAESAAAKSAIESNLGQLKQSFQEQGIRVDRFEVVVAQGQLSHDQGHPRRSRGWVDQTRHRSSGRSEGDFAGALAEATRPVDFRA